MQSLSSIPLAWREQLAAAICSSSTIGNLFEIDCNEVKDCETVTTLSEFTIVNGTSVCISFTNEDNVKVTRCFDFSEILNNSIANIDPACIATASEWSAMTYKEKWQTIIDKVCEDCQTVVEATSTTTSSTTTTTTEPTTTTTTTEPTTSTTTTTTEAPQICKQYKVTNNTGDVISGGYETCSFLFPHNLLQPGQTIYICAFEGTVGYAGADVEDQGICDGVPSTTTSTTSASSTTTTTTQPPTTTTTTTTTSTTTTTTSAPSGCTEYVNNSGDVINGVDYTDCDGNVFTNQTIADLATICVQNGTLGGNSATLTQGAECFPASECVTFVVETGIGGASLDWTDCLGNLQGVSVPGTGTQITMCTIDGTFNQTSGPTINIISVTPGDCV